MILLNYKGNSSCTGIYCIKNLINNKVYIGSTKRAFHSRKVKHLKSLNNNKHGNEYLQNSWNKYGHENFSFEIILICDATECEKEEANFIKFYKSNDRNFGYNLASVVEYRFNYKLSKKHTKEKSNRKKEKSKLSNGLFSEEIGLCKPIKVYDLFGKLIKRYDSSLDFCKEIKGSRGHLCTILKHRKLRYRNNIVIFERDVLSEEDLKQIIDKRVRVNITDIGGKNILNNLTVKEASIYLGCQEAELRMCYTGKRKRIRDFKIIKSEQNS